MASVKCLFVPLALILGFYDLVRFQVGIGVLYLSNFKIE
jgi:hypothetical protein